MTGYHLSLRLFIRILMAFLDSMCHHKQYSPAPSQVSYTVCQFCCLFAPYLGSSHIFCLIYYLHLIHSPLVSSELHLCHSVCDYCNYVLIICLLGRKRKDAGQEMVWYESSRYWWEAEKWHGAHPDAICSWPQAILQASGQKGIAKILSGDVLYLTSCY